MTSVNTPDPPYPSPTAACAWRMSMLRLSNALHENGTGAETACWLTDPEMQPLTLDSLAAVDPEVLPRATDSVPVYGPEVNLAAVTSFACPACV